MEWLRRPFVADLSGLFSIVERQSTKLDYRKSQHPKRSNGKAVLLR